MQLGQPSSRMEIHESLTWEAADRHRERSAETSGCADTSGHDDGGGGWGILWDQRWRMPAVTLRPDAALPRYM